MIKKSELGFVSRPEIMLAMMKVLEVNSEMTEKFVQIRSLTEIFERKKKPSHKALIKIQLLHTVFIQFHINTLMRIIDAK